MTARSLKCFLHTRMQEFENWRKIVTRAALFDVL